MERQIDEKIMKKQNEIAASSFRSNKIRRNMKIYVSNTVSFSEGVGEQSSLSGLSSLTSIGNASNENLTSLSTEQQSSMGGCLILRIEGKIDQTGLSPPPTNLNTNSSIKKFTYYLKSLVVEFEGEDQVIEWKKFSGENQSQSQTVNSDGFEIKKRISSNLDSNPNSNFEIPCKIHLQFDFSPERFRLSSSFSNLLNLKLATRPAIVVALWQYIKLHKLQESDEKKIINNDSALQELFKVNRMSFSDIPLLIEPHLLPPEPLTISYTIKSKQELNVLEQVFEVEIDLDDPKSSNSSRTTFLPSNIFRDLNFYEGRLKELIEALHSSKTNQKLLKSFSENPIETAQKILKNYSKDYETVVGDLPFTLDELKSSEFYESEQVTDAVTDFLALNPRFLPNL